MSEKEEIPYIQPSIEGKLSKEKREEVQQIIQEIKNFGISQRQLLYLVYHLALNLEQREIMLAITNAVNANREQVKTETIVTPKIKLATVEPELPSIKKQIIF